MNVIRQLNWVVAPFAACLLVRLGHPWLALIIGFGYGVASGMTLVLSYFAWKIRECERAKTGR